jgi:hypothetical protein
MLRICFSDDTAAELSITEGVMELENGNLPVLVFETTNFERDGGIQVKLHDGDIEELIELLQNKLVGLRNQMELIERGLI